MHHSFPHACLPCPALPDLILPLMLAVTEFFLFGVLAHQVNALSTPQTTVKAWYLASTGFGVFASLSVARARGVIIRGRYSNDLSSAIHKYSRRLVKDMVAAATTAIVSLLPVVFLASNRDRPAVFDYVVVSALAVFYCAGFISHGKARNLLMNALQ